MSYSVKELFFTLQGEGHQVVQAQDGVDGLEAAKAQTFDLVITDWSMPRMDGLALVKAIRADAKLALLPVLLVTAEAKKGPIVEAAECGVNGYIVKPFTANTLSSKIDKIFKRVANAA